MLATIAGIVATIYGATYTSKTNILNSNYGFSLRDQMVVGFYHQSWLNILTAD